MAEPNPFQPPSDESLRADSGTQSRWRTPFVAVLLVAIAGTWLTFLAPTVVVPAVLLLLPAVLRYRRVDAARGTLQIPVTRTDRAWLLFVSLGVAIPVAVASLVLFCCICTPVGFVAASIKSQSYGPTPLGFGVAVFLGLLAALWLGQFMMRRGSYYSAEVKQAEARGDR